MTPFHRITVVGPGRMGRALGRALSATGRDVTFLARSPRPPVEGLPVETNDWAPPVRAADIVLIAVPDAAIPQVAARLHDLHAVRPVQVVLHLSGLLDRRALVALEPTGAALGSWHPLRAVADPAALGRDAFRSTPAGIEGDPEATRAAVALSASLGMLPVLLPTGTKSRYHAAAAIVSNYTVVLAALAERIAKEAGITAPGGGGLYATLLRGTVDNLARMSPADALTGPIRRGDAQTVASHLRALEGADREVYRVLGEATLRLARENGLPQALADDVARALADAARS